jgi:hypothetical protein
MKDVYDILTNFGLRSKEQDGRGSLFILAMVLVSMLAKLLCISVQRATIEISGKDVGVTRMAKP